MAKVPDDTDPVAGTVMAMTPEPVEITIGDLLLRPWQDGDVEAMYRACQDPLIQRWTTVPSPYHREHAVKFVTELSPHQWATGAGAPIGVFDRTTGELLGSCGLVWIRDNSGELGYWTAPWARSRGVRDGSPAYPLLLGFRGAGPAARQVAGTPGQRRVPAGRRERRLHRRGPGPVRAHPPGRAARRPGGRPTRHRPRCYAASAMTP